MKSEWRNDPDHYEDRRSPRGGRGLKYVDVVSPTAQIFGRSPRGGRGLKLEDETTDTSGKLVALLAEGVD